MLDDNLRDAVKQAANLKPNGVCAKLLKVYEWFLESGKPI